MDNKEREARVVSILKLLQTMPEPGEDEPSMTGIHCLLTDCQQVILAQQSEIKRQKVMIEILEENINA